MSAPPPDKPTDPPVGLITPSQAETVRKRAAKYLSLFKANQEVAGADETNE